MGIRRKISLHRPDVILCAHRGRSAWPPCLGKNYHTLGCNFTQSGVQTGSKNPEILSRRAVRTHGEPQGTGLIRLPFLIQSTSLDIHVK